WYSNTFCQFVRAGWGLCLLGSFCLLLSVGKRQGRPDIDTMRRSLAAGGAVLGAGAIMALSAVTFSALELDWARDATERGLPEIAIDHIDLVTRVVPALGQSSELALQRGLLEDRLG